MEPGVEALAILQAIDPAGFPEAERLLILQAWERQHAWLCACQQAVLAAVAGPEPTNADDWVVEEIAAALKLSSVAARQRVHTARTVTRELPGTQEMLAAGEISFRHALAAVDLCGPLAPAGRAAVEARVLPKAGHKSVAEFRRSLRRAILAVAPADTQAEFEEAREHADVRLAPEPGGMASVIATMPAADARALFLAVDTLAKARHAAYGGKRSGVRMGQRRVVEALVALADAALSDRALPKAHGRPVELQIVIDLPTLLKLREEPAQLAGYGPIPAGVARELAGDASWRRLVTDPITGHLLDYGRATYRPPQALADYLAARDRACRFPGCNRSAYCCDIDHAKAFDAGGHTSSDNCGMLCRRHHRLKTFRRLKIKTHPDRSISWHIGDITIRRLPPRTNVTRSFLGSHGGRAMAIASRSRVRSSTPAPNR
jgi:hypothetical protein